ncbi:MAG: PilZ domain-containing protein [Nitrospirae bacterium]|nr:PilZ domain-containing protein [Nitrospirota bacterium]
MAFENNGAGADRREFVRIDDTMPVEVAVIPRERGAEVRSRITVMPVVERPEFQAVETGEAAILKYLMAVNAKLDLLINAMITEKGGVGKARNRRVNVSACGMRFAMDTKPVIGDIVELKMILPGVPPMAVDAFGEVVWIEGAPQPDGRYLVAARFVAMDDDVRDEIVGYIFNRQREHIRNRREGRQA